MQKEWEEFQEEHKDNPTKIKDWEDSWALHVADMKAERACDCTREGKDPNADSTEPSDTESENGAEGRN
eukprot:85778-Rhodomonas_salina.1